MNLAVDAIASMPGDTTIGELCRFLRYAPWFTKVLNDHPKATLRVYWRQSGNLVDDETTLEVIRPLIQEGKAIIVVNKGEGT